MRGPFSYDTHQNPAEWLPPDEGYRCQYVATWAATKLGVDAAEQQKLTGIAMQGPNAPVTQRCTALVHARCTSADEGRFG